MLEETLHTEQSWSAATKPLTLSSNISSYQNDWIVNVKSMCYCVTWCYLTMSVGWENSLLTYIFALDMNNGPLSENPVLGFWARYSQSSIGWTHTYCLSWAPVSCLPDLDHLCTSNSRLCVGLCGCAARHWAWPTLGMWASRENGFWM